MSQGMQSLLARPFRKPGILLAGAAVLISAPFIVPWWERDFYFDSAVFGGLARSLLEGEGYRFMGEAHGKYPPGYPALLALVQWLGLGFRGVHAVVAAGSVASVLLTFVLLRDRHGRWFAFAAAALTLINHDFVGHQAHVLSDLPFLALSLGTILSAERLRREPSWRRAVLTALLGVAAASVRSIGLALAPAILLGLLLRRRAPGEPPPSRASLVRAGFAAGAVLAFVGAWLLYGEAINRQAREDLLVTVPYHQELIRQDAVDESRGMIAPSHVLDRFVFNTTRYAELTGELLDGRERHGWLAVRLLSIAVLVGWGIAFWRRREIVDWYFATYLAVLSVWSGPEGTRFLLGLLPLIYHYLLVALAPWSLPPPGPHDGEEDPAGAFSGPWRRASIAVIGVIASLTFATSAWPVFKELRGHVRRPFYTDRAAEFHEAIAWVDRNVPEDTPLVLDKAPMAHFLTGRLAYKFATVPDHDRVVASIARRGAPVLVVNDFHSNPHYLQPVIEARPELFEEIHRVGEHVVYRFVPGGGDDG